MHLLRCFKVLLFLLLGIAFNGTGYAQNTKIDLKEKKISLEELFNTLNSKSGYSFVVNRDSIDLRQTVIVNITQKTIQEILNYILDPLNLSYKIYDKHITVFNKFPTSKNNFKKKGNHKISGIITSVQNEPLIGANIKVIGDPSKITISDYNGNFTIDDVPIGSTLIISYIGYDSQEILISEDTKTIIQLEENTKALSEVVVVGFGTQKKETVTGAISTMATKELLQSPQANVSNMLGGRMSGLLSVQQSGEPGNDQSILRIRGVGTFSGSQDPLVLVDGIETQNYNNIDPNEIESLSILKDASATAVYGVRGANGVLLITTKRGVLGKPKISYSSNFANTSFIGIRKAVDGYQYATLLNEARKYDSYITNGYTPKYTAAELEKFRTGNDPTFYPNTDWYGMLLKPSSFQTQHNINVSGGTEAVKYFISGGYFNQSGLINQINVLPGYNMNMNYERYNFRSGLDFDISKDFTIKFNFSTQIENRKGPGKSASTLMANIAQANPVGSPGVIDGKLVEDYGTYTNNPLRDYYQGGYKEDTRNYISTSLRFNYKLEALFKGLSTHFTISNDNFYMHTSLYIKPVESYTLAKGVNNTYYFVPKNVVYPFNLSETMDKNRRDYLEFGFDYNRTFANDHTVTALLLYNQTKYFSPKLEYNIPNGYQGVVGRVTYGYKKKYLAEFNAGYNGTENFAEGRRFGFFPAYSLGWVASEEPFFPKTKLVSFWKFRASYGEVGNDKIGGARFLYLPTAYGYNLGYNFGEVGSNFLRYPGSYEGQIGNPLLTWERAKKLDIGTELSIFDSKVKINVDYYSENRDNILTYKGTIPDILGATLPAYNLGRMTNSGWDGDITFRDKINKFNYWLKANHTYSHNIVQFQDEVSRPFTYQNRTGQSYGQYFGLVCTGIYNSWTEVNDPNRPVYSWQNNKIQPGDLKYKDVNGDGIINDDDQVPIGYSNFPEIIYGVSFGGDWKGFDFSVLFQGATNVSYQYSSIYRYGFTKDYSAPAYLVNSWSQERYVQGLPILYPHLSVGADSQLSNYQNSTFWIRDASYLRLKNIEVGYSLRPNAIKAIGISSARIYVNANNLITWSSLFQGVDPEAPVTGSNSEPYPLTRVINFGLNVSF